MPILGIVVTHPAPAAVAPLLREVPGICAVGEPFAGRVAAVAETSRKQDDEPLFDALRALPGVLAVDLAYADFSDLSAPDEVSS
jgi:hypothetical protein